MGKIEQLFKKEYLLFILCIAITLFNTVNMQKNTVLLLSIPQYLLVFFLIIKRNYRAAFILHSVFIAACVSLGIVIEEGQSPFLYTKFRLYGPLTFNLIILLILWLSLYKKNVILNEESLLLRTRKIILYLLLSGTVIGFWGCIFIQYYDWKFLISRVLFIGEILLFIDIFIRLYSDSFSKCFAIAAICMMAAAPVASVLSFSFWGVQAFYGYQATPFVNPIMSLTPCLIIAVFQLKSFKLRIISLISLVFYALHLMILSRGSQFLDIFVVLVLLVYLVYFKKSNNFQIKSLKIILPLLLVALVPMAIGGLTSSSDISLKKFEQFTSLFTILDFSGNNLSLNFEDIGSSPYVRVGELANILHEGVHNIFALFFGKGYGGYYTDSLHFFDGIDLSRGAFSYEAALQGRFYNAHSAIPSLSHYNGLIGLFLMLKLAFLYLRKVEKTFLVFAAFVLFVQSFYFDMYGCFSFIMALFGAECFLNASEHEDH